MKKSLSCVATLALVLALAGCGAGAEQQPSSEASQSQSVVEESNTVESSSAEESSVVESVEETVSVMSYADYIAAELDSEVVVETYVQAKQSWWEDKATVYTQDEDGAYFLYNMACSEEDYAKLTPGTKIRVTGFKAEWAGEVEITDATFEIIEGSFVAEAMDATALLGTEELIKHQNEFVAFKNMTVAAAGKNEAGEEVAFLYNWDGSGTEGNDLYFKVALNDAVYTFTVESYLCGPGTDVYEAVKNLNIGDTVDMEGFLYWYEGVNPHITRLTVK